MNKESYMLLRLLLVVVILLSFGCTHVGGRGEVLAENKPVVEKVIEPAIKKPVEPSRLSAALLYSLLGGEIAGQRGDVNSASAFYADAARRSRDPKIALRAAQIALYNKDTAAAKAAIEILRESNELPLESYRLALIIYLRSGDVPKSLLQIDELLKETNIPKRNALLLVGDLVLRNASKVVALEVMDSLAKAHVDEAGVYVASSQIMSHFGGPDKAESDARKATVLDPSWALGYVQLALVLENKGNSGEAFQVLKESSERLDARQLTMGYGQLLAKHGRYIEAKEQFLKLTSKNESYPAGRFALGLVYLKLDEVDSAKDVFTSLYKVEAFSSRAAFYLGRINHHQKQYKDAIVWFTKIERGNHYIDSQVNIATIKSKMGDLDGARVVLQSLRNDYPKDARRFYLLEGELLMDDLRYQDAYRLLKKGVAEMPTSLSLRYMRSIAATEVNDIAMAENDLLYVLQETPRDANALNALGYTLASKTNRFKEARKYLTEALLLRPNEPAILDSMGWLTYREGAHQKALALLETAYAKSPEGEIAAHLGEVLWVLGRKQEAEKVWAEALERDKKNRYLIEVLQRLK